MSLQLFGTINVRIRWLLLTSILCIHLPSTTLGEWRYVGVPFANFTADKGIGYGVFGSTFDRADTQTIVPYRLAFEGQFYQTTGDYTFHKLKSITQLIATVSP